MKFVLYTNSVSAHQLPLAREIVKRVGVDNFRYIYTEEALQGGSQEVTCTEQWVVQEMKSKSASIKSVTDEWLESADAMLVGGIRPIELIERRLSVGQATFYMSERWLKPIPIFRDWYLPGWLKLLHPCYFNMARRFARLFKSENYKFLPIGPWALKDMKLLCRITGISVSERQIMPWGYFVENSDQQPHEAIEPQCSLLRVLWVGRMLQLKHVDTIIRAVAEVYKEFKSVSLTLVGEGPEKIRLMKLATKVRAPVEFVPPVSLREVRDIMRRHDVYVFSSNGFDGWGAVVSEALIEGMNVLGSFEAGAPSALLPKDHLFHCHEWKRLSELLIEVIQGGPASSRPSIGAWTAEKAAERLLKEVSND